MHIHSSNKQTGKGKVADSATLCRWYEATPGMLHQLDLDGHLLMVSNHWLAKLGYEREEVIGRKITDFLTTTSHYLSESSIRPIFMKTGRVDDIAYQMVAKTGGNH